MSDADVQARLRQPARRLATSYQTPTRLAQLMACLQRIEDKVDRYLETRRQQGAIRLDTTDR